jgi:hypothetical protein
MNEDTLKISDYCFNTRRNEFLNKIFFERLNLKFSIVGSDKHFKLESGP